MTIWSRASVALAQAPPPPGAPGGQGAEFGKSSPVGLVLLILFGIAVAFLVRSMSKHLRKVPVNFDEARAEQAAPARARRSREKSGTAETSGGARPAGSGESTEAGESTTDTDSREGE